MSQLYLFTPRRLDQRRLQVALERLDVKAAKRALERFRRDSPGIELVWEEEAYALLANYQAGHLSLDQGCRLWSELRTRDLFSRIPGPSAALMEKRFFQLLLAMNRLEAMQSRRPAELSTSEGRSLADLHIRAGYFRHAQKLIERQLAVELDSPELLLLAGNCSLKTGHRRAAGEHYRDALLKGLSPRHFGRIADERLAGFLRSADFDGCWAVVEAAVEGILPVPSFESAAELGKWTECFDWLGRPPEATVPDLDEANQFYVCLVLSANRIWNPPELVPARLRMKRLHPRLHQRHMDRIETLPFAHQT